MPLSPSVWVRPRRVASSPLQRPRWSGSCGGAVLGSQRGRPGPPSSPRYAGAGQTCGGAGCGTTRRAAEGAKLQGVIAESATEDGKPVIAQGVDEAHKTVFWRSCSLPTPRRG
ncbi:unnamed protein product [Prorocentrum cordatum]|uniref:Uncharacterized protein n=1 Tax=Prorocentrum cordatum TaxID=2364126 RepID=A0ABN9PYQ3_9DINO|nr:unnamed protein product [Polarella glacialis]